MSHLPKGIPTWEAATHGVSCIEHVAESILASPIYAGYVKTPQEAAVWCLTSPKADSFIEVMAYKNIFHTPTLIAFKTYVDQTGHEIERNELSEGLNNLMKITLKLHQGGIKILTRSDFNSLTTIIPGKSIFQEMDLLVLTGLTEKETRAAVSKNFEPWLVSKY